MNNGALIIGGSPAGLQAGLELADSGIEVHLIEPSPFLGGGGAKVPGHLLSARMLEAARHPRITIWTNTRLHGAKWQQGSFRLQLQQHPRYVDLAKCTGCGDCIDVCPVMVPEANHKAIYLMDGVQPGCAAIEKLGKAPCASACPGGIHVQGYVALVAEGRFQEALDLIREAIPFPGIIGRICTHPCELNCRRSEIDSPVSIRLLKRFVADWELKNKAKTQSPKRSEKSDTANAKKVAVVGSGPAGMTVADRLARWGYWVTVFEKLPLMAGMLAVGIPEYRLPQAVIAREYRRIEALGVDIRLNTPIGPNGEHTLDDLFDMGYEAICLAIGAHKSLRLGISGEELPGVIHGLELLMTINLSQKLDKTAYKAALTRLLPLAGNTRAVVLGGGNTAMDVARSLKRVGVQQVRVIYRRTRAEMPALPEEVDETEQEGVAIEYLTAPTGIVGDPKTGVTGLECIRMKLGEPDDSGRRRPIPMSGSEFRISVDLVVVAIGQVSDIECLGSDDRIFVTRDQRIQVDSVTLATNRPGVFAAGDAVTRDKMSAIEAIGMGKKAAAEIDAYLRGLKPGKHPVDDRQMPVARRELSDKERVPKPRIPVPVLSAEKRLGGFAEIELGYSPQQAMTEAQRCLVCGPCSECLACVQACKPEAIVHKMQATLIDLEIGAIICPDDQTHSLNGLLKKSNRVYRVPPHDLLMGSAAAAQIMSHLGPARHVVPSQALSMLANDPARIGVFICECGHLISEALDTDALREHALTWPGVAHAQVLAFSCTPEAEKIIRKTVLALDLNRLVLGACACCSLDQVCYSCTYQRVRCKANLGLFGSRAGSPQQKGFLSADYLPPSAVEFVNIREQCAFAHPDSRRLATDKASAMIEAAVAKTRLLSEKPLEAAPTEGCVMILGGGVAARCCRELLLRQNVAAVHVAKPPLQIWRADHRYTVMSNGKTWTGDAVVLTPCDSSEAQSLYTAFGEQRYRPRVELSWGGLETHRPGIFYCDPSLDGYLSGAAAASRVSAWLGRIAADPGCLTAAVDPHRCRACKTCIEICEFGAPQLIGHPPNRTSWIDPVICTGCGTCAANCPSGAITAGYSTDEQLEAMIDAVLH